MTPAADAPTRVANFRCISAAGKSIERVLNACFGDDQPIDEDHPVRAMLVQSEDFGRDANDNGNIPARSIAVFLYRVEVNKVMRAAWSAVGSYDGQAHLPIDLHYLLIAFADNAEWEQQILGRAIQCLEDHPILTGPMLYPTAEWAPNEAVHLYVEDLGFDSLVRTFDSLAVDFRLCVPYLGRIVRVDGHEIVPPAETSTVVKGLVPA